jgi:DnaJ-like protein/nuclease-like protein
MPESPLSASPYEVLGVDPSSSQDELRRAYRRQLRLTHPDAGGSAAAFHAVQRAWERIGTPESRADYDRGSGVRSNETTPHAWSAPAARAPRPDSRPQARSYGHPGGWRREHYLTLMREWLGRGVTVADAFDPALVRTAPREIRHELADALAEEATARSLTTLGIGYTVWHDVVVPRAREGTKIDHVVLGPAGLFAVQSEDWGTPVTVHRGDLAGDGVDHQVLHTLAGNARLLGKATRVRFSVAVVVVPDDAFDESFRVVGKARGIPLVVAQASYLPQLMRVGIPEGARPDGTELFEVRTRLQNGITFV